ncbi:MAG: hypothetical protein PHY73_05695 [Candidatus Omnitrophica bacterium]|nr:hypothetical protein [Candidatus Omnitrophota bacterium]
MKRRFTDTDKWESGWFADLPAPTKLVYLYLIERADLGGFIELREKHISYMTGLSLEEIKQALKDLKVHYICSNDNSGLVWIKDYLFIQSNIPLQLSNPAHKGAMKYIEQHINKFNVPEIEQLIGLEVSTFKGASKHLQRVIGNSNSNIASNGNRECNLVGNGKVLGKGVKEDSKHKDNSIRSSLLESEKRLLKQFKEEPEDEEERDRQEALRNTEKVFGAKW